jgi:hypothetical protein
MKTLDTFKQHQKKIAVQTLKLSDAGAAILGGMTKSEARNFLRKSGWSEAKVKKLEQ